MASRGATSPGPLVHLRCISVTSQDGSAKGFLRGIWVLNRDPGFREVSGESSEDLETSWGFLDSLVVTSAFAEVDLVYELSANLRGAFRDVVF